MATTDLSASRKTVVSSRVVLLLIALLVALTACSAASDSARDQQRPARGPSNEKYEPPIYQPTATSVHHGARVNPLVRPWGVYQGLDEHTWLPYLHASADQKAVLDEIVQRPKTTWFGQWQEGDIQERIEEYVERTTGGDPDVLVQTAIFRMEPWETDACTRLPSSAEQASYKKWIAGFAAGVGEAHMAIIMQPDGPFVLCAPGGSELPAKMIKSAVRTLSALPNTSVYIDAGAADWNRDDPKKALEMLIPMGIRFARGFALNSTHYDSTARQVRHSAAISRALAARGMPGKYGVINTSSNGRPFKGYTYPDRDPNFDNAPVCASEQDDRCVTLGIPPTVDVGDPKWGLTPRDRRLAVRYVDAYMWFGRPWLYKQRAPFMMDRALDLVRTTPY